MTTADDLPALPERFEEVFARNGQSVSVWSVDDMRAYALAARAERDALFETQRKTLESQRGELMRKCAERDAEIERLRGALEKISAIRDDIVGRQTINWSAHIYPLVAALEEAGFEGAGYEEARTKAKTQDDRIAELEEKLIGPSEFETAERK